MKVILKEDVKALGKKGAVVNVSDGYAKNFLFPKKLAVDANDSNMKLLNDQKEAMNFKKETQKENAQKLKVELEKLNLQFKIKAGANGKIFGSVTSKDISEKLKSEYKFDVDKKQILLNEPIKTIGIVTVDVKLYEGIISKLKITIKQEV